MVAREAREVAAAEADMKAKEKAEVEMAMAVAVKGEEDMKEVETVVVRKAVVVMGWVQLATAMVVVATAVVATLAAKLAKEVD